MFVFTLLATIAWGVVPDAAVLATGAKITAKEDGAECFFYDTQRDLTGGQQFHNYNWAGGYRPQLTDLCPAWSGTKTIKTIVTGSDGNCRVAFGETSTQWCETGTNSNHEAIQMDGSTGYIGPDNVWRFNNMCWYMLGGVWLDADVMHDRETATWVAYKNRANVSVICEVATQPPAVSAGDPHILRFDGTAFDIDTTGSYSLFNVAGGGQFSVKSKVAHENRLNSKLTFNMECEFGGSWLGGHNVTAVAAGVEAGREAGIYFDGLFVSIPKLLQNTSQYTWEFTGHSKMILEICQTASKKSDYCISTSSLRRKSHGGHAFMTMVTDVANVTVRYTSIRFAGHLDIYTTLQQGADSTQIGGLLAGGRHATRRGDSPLLASSVGAVGDVGIEG